MAKQENQAESDIQACLRIKDDGKALSCVKKVVEKTPKGEGPKLVLLVSEGCTPCEEEAALHQKEIDKGIIQVVDSASDEGIDIIGKNDIKVTPSLFLLDKENKLMELA